MTRILLIVLTFNLASCSNSTSIESNSSSKPTNIPKVKQYPHTVWDTNTSDPQHLCWDEVMTVEGYRISICDATLLDDGRYVRNDMAYLYDSLNIDN